MADVTMSDRDVQDLGAFRYLGSTPGELAKKIADLERDNQKERDKAKAAEEKAKAVPAEGSVVLTGEDATEYTAFKALALKSADVAKLQEKVTGLETKDAERSRKDAFSDAVKALKWPEDTVATLLDMNSLNGATVEMKTEKVAGKDGKQEDTQVPYVTLPGEGQKAQKFSEFAAASPQLKGIRTQAGSGQADGVVAAEMRGHAGTESTPAGGIDEMIAGMQKAASAGNPLKPAKTT